MPPSKKRHLDTESGGEPQVTKRSKGDAKKSKGEASKGTDAEGNTFWEIGNNRRIGSSKFKGSTLVNIREYYTTPDGELRPGKKGISLSLDQYKALLKVLPELNEELRAQGHAVDNPPASGSGSALVKSDAPKESKSKKSNIEETSDEEDEEDE